MTEKNQSGSEFKVTASSSPKVSVFCLTAMWVAAFPKLSVSGTRKPQSCVDVASENCTFRLIHMILIAVLKNVEVVCVCFSPVTHSDLEAGSCVQSEDVLIMEHVSVRRLHEVSSDTFLLTFVSQTPNWAAQDSGFY